MAAENSGGLSIQELLTISREVVAILKWSLSGLALPVVGAIATMYRRTMALEDRLYALNKENTEIDSRLAVLLDESTKILKFTSDNVVAMRADLTNHDAHLQELSQKVVELQKIAFAMAVQSETKKDT